MVVYGAFRGCTSLASIRIPRSWRHIEPNTFENCTSLTSIVLPNGVTKIGYCAFKGCTSLVSIRIPSSVNKIEWNAFEGCTSLSSIKIPSSVKEIYDSFLKGCNNLVEIHLRHKKPIYFTSAFDGRDLTDYPSDFYPTPLGYLSKVFDGLDLSKITLYVPIGSEYEYQQHPFYSKFAKIVSEK